MMLKCRYTRAEQAEAARRGLIGLELPIPDARFEQGYLMSIRRESRRLICRIDLADVGAVSQHSFERRLHRHLGVRKAIVRPVANL